MLNRRQAIHKTVLASAAIAASAAVPSLLAQTNAPAAAPAGPVQAAAAAVRVRRARTRH